MNFTFKKKYGQNFLKHESVSSRIVSLIDADKDTLVLEIGPGSGALTKYLRELEFNTLCYEIDRELESALNKYKSDKLDIIFDDFMKRDILNDIGKYNYKKLIIIGNLPYYITTPIILKIIETVIPDEMVFMVQKEVAARFSAKNNTKEYGSITILLNYYFNVSMEFIVKRDEFIPAPNVDSAVIKFKKKEHIEDIDMSKFNKILKDAFMFKRKNLRNNLKNYNREEIEKLLSKYNYDLNNRAEDLPLEVFIELSKII